MVNTSEVFTPTKTPTFTSVKRDALWDTLDLHAEQGGAFISVLGTTKLGKSTLVKSVMQTAAFHSYIPGQTLVEGGSALWSRLAADLGIPTSSTTGKVVGDKSQWKFFGRFGITVPLVGDLGGGSEAGGERHIDHSNDATHEIDAPSAVGEALATLALAARAEEKQPPIIVIDDFHFVLNPDKRREIVLALRPITETDVTVILATLPGREADEGFKGTNVGGRHYLVEVPVWDKSELREIAESGFKTLNVAASSDLIDTLVEQSFGSPQIMQQLCLNLCRLTNKVKNDKSGVGQLDGPNNWRDFFRIIKDPHSWTWLATLGIGLTQRRPRKAKAELPDGRSLDGYQLILWALHDMGAPVEVSFIDVRSKISALSSVHRLPLGVREFALEQKAKNMNLLASHEMTQALENLPVLAEPGDDGDDEELFSDDEIRLANRVPQPVFEVVGTAAANMTIRILDPLLAYTLNWHPESFYGKTSDALTH